MKKTISKIRNQSGLSFLEVMIALAITGVVTASIFRLYVTQHQNYMIQDDITEVQQNARASIDQLGRTIRMAGYDIPDGVAAIEASNTDPDTIVMVFRQDDCDTYLLNDMTSSASILECATSVNCFSDNDWVFIFEPDSGGGEWFQVKTKDGATNTIEHTSPLSKAYNKDAIIVTMERIKFYIDDNIDVDNPALMVQTMGGIAQVFAKDIVDLQFQYKMKNGMTLDQPVLVDNIREVVISLTGRSMNPDPEDTSNDPYRYRSFRTSVNLRNMAG